LEEDALSGKLSRRALVQRGLLLGLSIPAIGGLLAACGGGSSSSSTASGGGGSTAASGGSSGGGGGAGVLVPGLEPPGTKEPSEISLKFQVFIKDAPYYVACAKGAEQACKDLGIGSFEFAGPQEPDASTQSAEINSWVTQKVDIICASTADPAMDAAVNAAIKAGLVMVEYDVEAGQSERPIFVAPVQAVLIGEKLAGTMAKATNKGPIAIISGVPTSETQNLYVEGAKKEAEAQGVEILATEYCDSSPTKAFEQVKALETAHSDLTGIVIVDGNGSPGAAKASKDGGGKVKVTCLSLPSVMKPYMTGSDPVVPAFWFWDVPMVGYVTVTTAYMLYQGKGLTNPYTTEIETGKTGEIPVELSTLNEGRYNAYSQEPIEFTPQNINEFDF
jgi:ABC-type sugar transport system substrate-binding protein